MAKRRVPFGMKGLVLAALVALACGIVAAACGGGATATVFAGPNPGLTLTAANARQSMTSFNQAFYRGSTAKGFYQLSTAGGQFGFWQGAEMIETAEDYYRYTADPTYRQLVSALCAGFLAHFGPNWMKKYKGGATGKYLGPRANDDIMWMVIAAARAYNITGDAAYMQMAATNFEASYARSWSADFGGGLWWRTDTGHARRAEKNTTTNMPAVIAACELYFASHDQKYLSQATSLYAWERAHLFNTSTGQVYDHIRYRASGGTRTYHTKFSYNQGTFIGAAALLYEITGNHSYYADATHALNYTENNMTTSNGVLSGDGTTPNQDTGGFKGIFARWAVRFARDNGITAYDSWFQRNAGAVWAHRNAKGLMGTNWTAPTGNGVLYAFDCSSAVAMMEALLPAPSATAPK